MSRQVDFLCPFDTHYRKDALIWPVLAILACCVALCATYGYLAEAISSRVELAPSELKSAYISSKVAEPKIVVSLPDLQDAFPDQANRERLATSGLSAAQLAEFKITRIGRSYMLTKGLKAPSAGPVKGVLRDLPASVEKALVDGSNGRIQAMNVAAYYIDNSEASGALAACLLITTFGLVFVSARRIETEVVRCRYERAREQELTDFAKYFYVPIEERYPTLIDDANLFPDLDDWQVGSS